MEDKISVSSELLKNVSVSVKLTYDNSSVANHKYENLKVSEKEDL